MRPRSLSADTPQRLFASRDHSADAARDRRGHGLWFCAGDYGGKRRYLLWSLRSTIWLPLISSAGWKLESSASPSPHSTVLIIVMLIAMVAFQWLAGEAKIGRRQPGAGYTVPAGAA